MTQDTVTVSGCRGSFIGTVVFRRQGSLPFAHHRLEKWAFVHGFRSKMESTEEGRGDPSTGRGILQFRVHLLFVVKMLRGTRAASDGSETKELYNTHKR